MAGKGYGSRLTKDGDVAFESDAWNIADGFVKLKILRLMIQLDKYETMSQYGIEELGEEIYFPPNEIAKRRKDALYRFCSTLKQLLGNVKFAIRKTDDSFIIDISKRIANVEQYLPDIITSKQNMITKEVELTINEEHFNTCFNILQNIKEEINTPLNKAGLIFKQSDEVDLETMMQDIIEGG